MAKSNVPTKRGGAVAKVKEAVTALATRDHSAYVKLLRARSWLSFHQVFFSYGVLSLKLTEQKGFGKEIAGHACLGTDGKHLFYDPEFVGSRTDGQLRTLLAKVAMHIYSMHHLRIGAREIEPWNEACSHAVYPILREANMELPKDVQINEDWSELPAETIYYLLDQQQSQNNQSDGNGKGKNQSNAGGAVVLPQKGDDGEELSEADKREAEANIQDVMKNAAEQAQRAGTLPATMERRILFAEKRTADWRSILRDFVAKNIPMGLSFNRLDRRMLSIGYKWPTVEMEGAPILALLMDTSGSIGDQVLSAFQTEVNAIVQETKPDKVVVVWFSDRVHKVEEFGRGEEVILKSRWSGGTDFEPAFRVVDEMPDKPAATIMFTDLEPCGWPQARHYPVLFANYNQHAPDREAPWGQTVQITNVGE